MTDTSSKRGENSAQSEVEKDHSKVREAIEQSEALPETLRAALLQRLEEGSSEEARTGIAGSFDVKRAFSSLRRAPSEVAHRVSQKVEELTNERVEQVRSEVKKLVERVDLQGEVIKLLSSISIELKTTVNLEPNEESPLGIKPAVKTKATLKWKDQESSNETSSEDAPELKRSKKV